MQRLTTIKVIYVTMCGITAFILPNFYFVTGKSMSPFINCNSSSSLLLLDRISCLLEVYKPHSNDVVVFKRPANETRSVVKRVAGVPGDYVSTRDSRTVFIEPGHFWAAGDNSVVSVDSNDYGQVPDSSLIGRCIFVIPLGGLFHQRKKLFR